MSFSEPLVLIGLVAIPLLIWWYVGQQRRREQAARAFVRTPLIPSVLAGQIQIARHPILLQSPTTDRALTKNAIADLRPGGGGTAIGDTITVALKAVKNLPVRDGRRPPGAIVLLSDGTSNVGTNPLTAARQAKADHIPIYTIALGTSKGTIPIKRGGKTVDTPVPVSPQQLKDIALASGGRAYTAANSANASAVYAHLAKQLGHKQVKQELTAGFAGGALALVLVGGVLSLVWFGRLT